MCKHPGPTPGCEFQKGLMENHCSRRERSGQCRFVHASVMGFLAQTVTTNMIPATRKPRVSSAGCNSRMELIPTVHSVFHPAVTSSLRRRRSSTETLIIRFQLRYKRQIIADCIRGSAKTADGKRAAVHTLYRDLRFSVTGSINLHPSGLIASKMRPDPARMPKWRPMQPINKCTWSSRPLKEYWSSGCPFERQLFPGAGAFRQIEVD